MRATAIAASGRATVSAASLSAALFASLSRSAGPPQLVRQQCAGAERLAPPLVLSLSPSRELSLCLMTQVFGRQSGDKVLSLSLSLSPTLPELPSLPLSLCLQAGKALLQAAMTPCSFCLSA